jgi:hypothetical protein
VPFYTFAAAKINEFKLAGTRAGDPKAKIDVASTGLDDARFGIRIATCCSQPHRSCRRAGQKQVKYEKYR